MAGRFKQTLRAGACWLSRRGYVAHVAGDAAPGAHGVAGDRVRQLTPFRRGRRPTRAPIGWVEFCTEYSPECDTKPTAPRDVVLTPKAWKDLVRVNIWVNDTSSR